MYLADRQQRAGHIGFGAVAGLVLQMQPLAVGAEDHLDTELIAGQPHRVDLRARHRRAAGLDRSLDLVQRHRLRGGLDLPEPVGQLPYGA